jgi:hypothetical protein
MIGAAAVLGYTTLGMGYCRHRQHFPLSLFTAGLVVVVAGHRILPHAVTLVSSVSGALMLAAAQIVNRRHATCCCEDDRGWTPGSVGGQSSSSHKEK